MYLPIGLVIYRANIYQKPSSGTSFPSIRCASASSSSAVRSRASQITGFSVRSACSRYHDAGSRSFTESACMALPLSVSLCSAAYRGRARRSATVLVKKCAGGRCAGLRGQSCFLAWCLAVTLLHGSVGWRRELGGVGRRLLPGRLDPCRVEDLERHAMLAEFLGEGQRVACRARQAVEPGHDEFIARAQDAPAQQIEFGPLAHARGLLDVDVALGAA